MMQCTVCTRSPRSKLPFYCPACARHSLYELRIDQVRALLAREASAQDADKIISRQPDSDESSRAPNNTSQDLLTRWDVYRATAQTEAAQSRIEEFKGQAEVLRKEIEGARSELSKLKSGLDRRRADYASATHNLVARRRSTLESVDKNIKKTAFRADQQHQRMAESRIFLCREAAKLYGLRQRRRKRGDTLRDDYQIGGVGIVDLKDLSRRCS